jgi:periplasmic protein TonB
MLKFIFIAILLVQVICSFGQSNQALIEKAVNFSSVGDTIFYIVEEMPTFKGGDKAFHSFIRDNFKYPKKAKKAGTQGVVKVSFVVDSKGKVIDVAAAEKVDPILDEAAIKLVSGSPMWTPGKHNGLNVSVGYSILIRYKLD